MQIFLIEDDTIYAEFIKKSLIKDSNYKVSIYGTAEEASDALKTGIPDALIIDYKLPGMTGIDFFEKIKSSLNENNKVIILSALDDGNLVLSFIQKGVRDYVIKDEHVIDSLKAVLTGSDDDAYLFR